jgi:hypothetical protein
LHWTVPTLAGPPARAGNAGVAAATNIVVAQANERMLALVYASVIMFCFITFAPGAP